MTTPARSALPVCTVAPCATTVTLSVSGADLEHQIVHAQRLGRREIDSRPIVALESGSDGIDPILARRHAAEDEVAANVGEGLALRAGRLLSQRHRRAGDRQVG